jgi:hypothetical protein
MKTLRALGTVQSRPQWRIVVESIERLIRSLPESEQRTVQEFITRRQ